MHINGAFRPRKSLGQHFLVDRQVAEKIVGAADVSDQDTVLEIGPGHGALTELLVARAHKVIAVEIDRRLGVRLKARFASNPNFVLLEADILQVDLRALVQSLPCPHLRIVANLPYSITSPVLFKLLDYNDVVDRAILTMQREVAERLVAEPGPNYSFLSLAVQLQSVPRRLFHIAPDAFRPKPKVQSSVLSLDLSKGVCVSPDVRRTVLRVAKTTFGQRRKMLRSSLLTMPLSKPDLAEIAEDTGIELSRRPETLSIEEWLILGQAVRRLKKAE